MIDVYEIDRIQILKKIDLLMDTVINRLLITFDKIESEAEKEEKVRLVQLSKDFHPDSSDEESILEDAYHTGIDYFIVHSEMKQDFINTAVTWLFHLFEKDCAYIFVDIKDNKLKYMLSCISISVDKPSNWYKTNKELRNLTNAIKHGEGRSAKWLRKHKPELISDSNLGSGFKINVTVEELINYKNQMKEFWSEFFKIKLKIN